MISSTPCPSSPVAPGLTAAARVPPASHRTPGRTITGSWFDEGDPGMNGRVHPAGVGVSATRSRVNLAAWRAPEPRDASGEGMRGRQAPAPTGTTADARATSAPVVTAATTSISAIDSPTDPAAGGQRGDRARKRLGPDHREVVCRLSAVSRTPATSAVSVGQAQVAEPLLEEGQVAPGEELGLPRPDIGRQRVEGVGVAAPSSLRGSRQPCSSIAGSVPSSSGSGTRTRRGGNVGAARRRSAVSCVAP